MKNMFLRHFDNIVKVKVEGKNINNYVKKLIRDKINIIRIIPISYHEIELILEYREYVKIKKYKTIYNVSIIKKYGKLKLVENLKKYYLLLIGIILAIFLLYFLSNMIFSIDVIHSNNEIKELIYNELKRYDIKKYSFKKKYSELEDIEEEILKNNKDKLEWIEIIESGTKYIIRVEERLINLEEEEAYYQDVIASKSAIITRIIAIKGEKVKEINSFVKKGEVVISGDITLPSGEIVYTKAIGEVYGLVWYQIDVEYPLFYKEEKLTGKKKKVLVINYFNKRLSLFDFNKYNSFDKNSKIIFYHNLLPISFAIEKQYELDVIDEVYTVDVALLKAKDLAIEKLKANNSKILEVNSVNLINNSVYDSKIKASFFISVIEEIGISQRKEIINDLDENNG